METTYRLVVIGDHDNFGQTAATAELAKLVPGDLRDRANQRLGIERTDWADHFGKMRPYRTILVEVENEPSEWIIGG